ncbi:hypothetical protein F1188_15055 [Roseospira marina]|uniref:Uncharacterized protein n=1 Tax=Roseospira marina TaxID=140057 RepID=A0A5M6I8E6_9PROT|nr:hypothetical protein [Roseospira marina]KAA5604534.1 hypothetical protein F1188_15055 [Roseospira marina]MBB4315277.1 hypothetical protein [Roseospira marina]MBB5088276.1 hypothetical protein [Roseospira marina]
MQRPTIAHTHVGHTMTAWPDTPGQAGLLDTAEREATTAAQAAEAAASANDLATIQARVRDMRHAIDPTLHPVGPGAGYGLRRALDGAVTHVRFAMESGDASANLRAGGPEFIAMGEAVLTDVGIMAGLSDAVLAARATGEARALAQELAQMAEAVRAGDDADHDGQIGVSEAGLRQMRQSLENTLAQENPPYTTVERRWLFNLIRLPSGDWGWKDPAGGGAVGAYNTD